MSYPLATAKITVEGNDQHWSSFQTKPINWPKTIRNKELSTKPTMFWLSFCWDVVVLQKMRGRGQRLGDRDRLSSRLRQKDGGRKTDRGIERVSRVAECRADGSWYGRSSGQASAVPSRPPGATQNSHPNILLSFSRELHEVITHPPNYE